MGFFFFRKIKKTENGKQKIASELRKMEKKNHKFVEITIHKSNQKLIF